jgi:hypothetical protein
VLRVRDIGGSQTPSATVPIGGHIQHLLSFYFRRGRKEGGREEEKEGGKNSQDFDKDIVYIYKKVSHKGGGGT